MQRYILGEVTLLLFLLFLPPFLKFFFFFFFFFEWGGGGVRWEEGLIFKVHSFLPYKICFPLGVHVAVI